MKKDRRSAIKVKGDSTADIHQVAGMNAIPETFAEMGQHHAAGLELADEYAKKIQSMVDEAITVIETVKKIPDFNANLSVELAFSCASMKVLTCDPRLDDAFLDSDEEPVSDTFIGISTYFV